MIDRVLRRDMPRMLEHVRCACCGAIIGVNGWRKHRESEPINTCGSAYCKAKA